MDIIVKRNDFADSSCDIKSEDLNISHLRQTPYSVSFYANKVTFIDGDNEYILKEKNIE